MSDLINEDKEDLTIVDGKKLEIGKEYFVKYAYGDNNVWKKIRITRITTFGHAWGVGLSSNYRIDGIITNGSYFVKELTSESELEEFATNWLINNLSNNINTPLPILFVKMFNDYYPNV
jgi:hypothetical protein